LSINWFNFSLQVAPIIILTYLYGTFWFTLHQRINGLTYLVFTATGLNLLYSTTINSFLTRKLYHLIHISILIITTVNVLAYKVNYLMCSLTSTKSLTLLLGYGVVANNLTSTVDALFIDQYVQYNSTRVELGT